jgi:hypothetical protein
MIEYYITRDGSENDLFRISKFAGKAEPDNVYWVKMVRKGVQAWTKQSDPEMHCDCPNRRRGKHINDKHGMMVAKWLLAGEPVGYFDDKGEFHGAADRAREIVTEYERDLAGEEWDNESASDSDGLDEADEGDR